MVTSAVAAACVLPAFLLGAMAVQVRRDLGFGEAGVGIAFAAFFAAGAAASVWLGRSAERRGPGRSLRLAGGVAGGTCIAVAAASRSLATLLAPLAVAGMANALCQPAANLQLARALPARRQGFAFAVKQSAVPSSTLLAGAAVPAVALTVGWRWAFVGAGVLSLVAAALVAEPPQRATPAAAGSRRAARPEAGEGPVVPVSVLVRLAVGVGLGAAAAGSLGSYLVSAAVDAGMDEADAGWVLTAGSLAGILTRLAAGARADRRTGGHLRAVAALVGTGAVAFVVLATAQPAVYVVVGPLAFCTAWAWPGLAILAVVRASPARPAAATGLTQTGTYIGALTGPLVFGLVAGAVGYPAAWLVSAALALSAAVAVLDARRALRRWREDLAAVSG